MKKQPSASPGAWEKIADALRGQGIDPDALADEHGEPVKCIVVASNLCGRVEELSRTAREQVVMVRVDTNTAASLDAWVETGQVKSRSEAAAVFIREGLRLYQSELEQLRDALREVETARDRLRARARAVLREDDTHDSNEDETDR